MKFRLTEVPFLGHIITSKGTMPNPTRVSALQNLPVPANLAELRRILGMFTFLSRFISNLSDVSALL